MPTEDEDITLTGILEQIRQSKTDYDTFVKEADDRILEIDSLLEEVSRLKKKEKDRHETFKELSKYQTMLLQIKTEIENQKKSMSEEMPTMNQIQGAVEKAIKWNTGDIF